MPYDYTDALPPQVDLMPHGTVATCILHIRPGGVGEDNMLMRSKDGGCEMLSCEFTVADGTYKGRKFWEYWVLAGTTDGHAKSVDINRRAIKAILDSAFGLDPKDEGPKARATRTVSLGQLEGIAFMGMIGVEKGGPIKDRPGENWPDKNILASVITRDKKDWRPVEQPPPFNGGGAGAAEPVPASAPTSAPIARPGWAS